MYRVMSRGDQRDDIFLDDVDRHDFTKSLAEVCGFLIRKLRIFLRSDPRSDPSH